MQKLADERLVVTTRHAGEPDTAEVSHEALIVHWTRLRSWVNEDREFLLWRERFRVLFTDWLRGGKEHARLMSAAMSAEAERWVREHGEGISDQERDFIAESVRAESDRVRKDRDRLIGELRHARRLRISIVALVTLVVIGMSLLYLYDFTHMTFRAASERAGLVADEIKAFLVEHLDRETAARGLHPASLEERKANWTQIIVGDPSVTEILTRTLANADLTVAVLISDDHGKVLAASSPGLVNSSMKPAEDFRDLQSGNWVRNLWGLMNRREDYTSTRPIAPFPDRLPLFNVTVVIRSVLLKHAMLPALRVLTLMFAVGLLVAISLAFVVRTRPTTLS